MAKSIEWCKETARELGTPLKELPSGQYELHTKNGDLIRGYKGEIEYYLLIQKQLSKKKKK